MNNIEKLVIVGSGPAGLTAGIYASRANLNPLIIEGNNPGGQLITTSYIENWPGEKSILGATLMLNIREHAKHFGARFLPQHVTEITELTELELAKLTEVTNLTKTGATQKLDPKNPAKKTFLIRTDKNQEILAHAVIVATGASARRLGCKGESEYWGKGITTCAICDGYFYKDKKVFILGGGDTAMEDASFMQKFTQDITIIHIGDKLSASVPMQQQVLSHPNIKIIYNSTITEFRGANINKNGNKNIGESKNWDKGTSLQDHLQEIEITNKKTGEKTSFKADGVFIAIGQTPNTGFLKGKVELSAYGHVITNASILSSYCQKNVISATNSQLGQTATSVPGIFAAGDVSDPSYKQAITSSGVGCMAAIDAERYLASLLK